MQKWFLLGVLLSFIAIFVPGLMLFGWQTAFDAQLIVDLIAILIVMLLVTLVKGSVAEFATRFNRKNQPHELFMPFYDQR